MSDVWQGPHVIKPGVHFIAPKTLEELLAEARAKKIAELNGAYEKEAASLVHEYPEVERNSWSEQKREAEAYLSWDKDQQGDAPETPVLDNILIGRNGETGTETLVELCEAVLDNVVRFTQFQQLTGKRQRLVKLVRGAPTVEAVEAISW